VVTPLNINVKHTPGSIKFDKNWKRALQDDGIKVLLRCLDSIISNNNVQEQRAKNKANKCQVCRAHCYNVLKITKISVFPNPLQGLCAFPRDPKRFFLLQCYLFGRFQDPQKSQTGAHPMAQRVAYDQRREAYYDIIQYMERNHAEQVGIASQHS
jgi:hypothetical protein